MVVVEIFTGKGERMVLAVGSMAYMGCGRLSLDYVLASMRPIFWRAHLPPLRTVERVLPVLALLHSGLEYLAALI